MPTQAMTVTPDGFVSEETGEFVQTGHTVEGSAIGEQARVNEVREMDERFITNEQSGETEYQNHASQQDIDNIVDSYGGQQTFNDISDWAANNTTPEDRAEWDSIIARGDLNEIAKAIETIHDAYQNRNESAEMPQEQAPEQDTDADDITSFVFENVIDEADYQAMIELAEETLDDETIATYNEVMTNGSPEMVEQSIRMLHAKLYGND